MIRMNTNWVYGVYRTFIYNIIISYMNICLYLGIKNKPQPMIKQNNLDDVYIDRLTKKFLKTFDCNRYELFSGLIPDYNQNIDPRCYEREYLRFTDVNDLQQKQDIITELQQPWSHRIMIESTPKGNVIMHYDINKQSFVYYADMQIPIKVLDACAMKYTLMFYCREFYLNTQIIKIPSLLSVYDLKYDDQELQRINSIKKKIFTGHTGHTSNCFAKLRNYKSVSYNPNPNSNLNLNKTNDMFSIIKNIPNPTLSLTTPPILIKNNNYSPINPLDIKIKCINRFIYMGKQNNFSFLIVPPKKVSTFINKHTQKISYLEYKLLKTNQLPNTEDQLIIEQKLDSIIDTSSEIDITETTSNATDDIISEYDTIGENDNTNNMHNSVWYG